MLNQDLNIFYFGGSGGFYFLHYLLLYNKHYVCFNTNSSIRQNFLKSSPDLNRLRLRDVDYANCRDPSWPEYEFYYKNFDQLDLSLQQELSELHYQHALNLENLPGWFDYQLSLVIKHQWQINQTAWKSTETWPINDSTIANCPVDRDYKLYYTCNDIDQWLTYPGKKIVLYTDIWSHIRLSSYKKAWKFQFDNYLYKSKIRSLIESSVEFHHDQCYEELYKAIEPSDQQVKLQDFVCNPERITGIMPNAAQLELRSKWLNNHPVDLLKRCQVSCVFS
jgi:hypothetical protein